MSVIRRIFKSSALREQAAREAEIADPIIARLVAATDRRLAHLKGMRERLQAPVLAARETLRRAVSSIPGPTEVSPASWPRDATVKALFARAEDAAAVFSNDSGTRTFFGGHPGADCVALLGLERHEKCVLASVMQGDIQVEVARTTVSFTNAKILAPSADESHVRDEILIRALEYLALRGLQRVGAARAQRQEMEKDRALLQAELRLAQRRGAGLGSLEADRDTKSVAQIERDLERKVRELEAGASGHLLPALLDAIADVLEHPHDFLRIEPSALAVDAMNFAVEPTATTPPLAIAQLQLAQGPPFAVLLARFPRVELRADTRLAEAERLL